MFCSWARYLTLTWFSRPRGINGYRLNWEGKRLVLQRTGDSLTAILSSLAQSLVKRRWALLNARKSVPTNWPCSPKKPSHFLVLFFVLLLFLMFFICFFFVWLFCFCLCFVLFCFCFCFCFCLFWFCFVLFCFVYVFVFLCLFLYKIQVKNLVNCIKPSVLHFTMVKHTDHLEVLLILFSVWSYMMYYIFI